MCYKTILVHVDRSKQAAARIELAARLARSHEAHLIGSGMSGLAMAYYRHHYLTYGGPLSTPELDQLKRDAEQALERFVAQVRASDISYESRYSDDEAGPGLVLQARYADLVVLSQADPGANGIGRDPQLPELLALHGGRPVLIVPRAGNFSHLERHALVAWDGSRAATRALTDALPLLRRSGRVTVAVFTPEHDHGAHGELPGADIACYLARHHLNVEVTRQVAAAGEDIGLALLSMAHSTGADLLVMGAYGHQRWREMLLGGVTRRVLEAMTVPVLMSH